MRKRWIAGVGGAVGVLALSLWMLLRPAPSVPGVLEASGRVEGDQAAVGTKVGGKIVRLGIREGDRVEAGVLIAELASEQVRAEVERAEHLLHAAREQVAQAEARVASARRQADAAQQAVALAEHESRARIGEADAALGAAVARLRQAEADFEKTARDHGRYRELFARELVAAQVLDQARAADGVARAAVDGARKQVVQAEETLELARASRLAVEVRRKEAETAVERIVEARAALEAARAEVGSARAALAVARAILADSRVPAPFRGTVLRKLVEPGQVVAAGTPLVTLVDLSRLHAKVYVTERELGKAKIGDPARVYADAFPRRYFPATVSQVSQEAEFTPRDVHMKDERVQLVFAVKLAIDNPAGVLKPGMPVDARIRWNPEGRWGDGLEER